MCRESAVELIEFICVCPQNFVSGKNVSFLLFLGWVVWCIACSALHGKGVDDDDDADADADE